LPQHAQQLQQQAFMHAQPSMTLGPQLSTPQATAQLQMLAAHRAQMDPGSTLYYNMCGGTYGAS